MAHGIACPVCQRVQKLDWLTSSLLKQIPKSNFFLVDMHIMYCYGEGFVKVLMQDYGMLHGVIAFIRTHYHA